MSARNTVTYAKWPVSRGQLSVSAVSSITNDVYNDESSVPVNFTATV